MIKGKTAKIMFTCVGRRVSLIKAFRSAAKRLGFKPVIIGTDRTELCPGFQLCDKSFVALPIRNNGYADELMNIIKKQRPHLLVPTVDLDLKIIAHYADEIRGLGCVPLISSEKIIDICQDKRRTFAFLRKNGFGTPETFTLKEALSKSRLKYPKFLKPWDGYASRGNAVVHNKTELRILGERVPNCIVQDFIEGEEYTCDVFVDFDMRVRCVVPRKRLEVRSGEVSKAMVVKDQKIMQQAGEVVEKIGAGPGVVTIQLIVDKKGNVYFIEINPRFGGGVPLSIKAGADFPKWLLSMSAEKQTKIKSDGFRDGLVMLRYDAEVWLK